MMTKGTIYLIDLMPQENISKHVSIVFAAHGNLM